MKTKVLILAIGVVALANNVLGQGQVTLANNASTLIRDPNTGTAVPVGSMSFQLLFGPVGTPEGSLVPVGPVVGTSAVVAGRIANTVIDISTAIVPAGGAATFQVWAWSSSFASWQAAAAGGGWAAKSALFNTNTSADLFPLPPPTPTSLAGLFTITLGWQDPPSVWQQPANTTVFFGQTATLRVTASGDQPISYQWYFTNGTPVSGANFFGANTGTLTITDVRTNNGTTGGYYCNVTNPFGTSRSASAIVLAVPVPVATIGLTGGQPTIAWAAQPYMSYSILAAAEVAGPYLPLVTGLTFNNTAGQFTDTNAPLATRFYKIVSP